MSHKLIITCIIENDFDVFELMYESIKDVADEIVLICGNLNTFDYFEEMNFSKTKVIRSDYEHNNKGANGKQRNVYLQYLKENHMGEWNLVLDADEVVDKPENIKKCIEEIEKLDFECASIHMRHFVGNLGQEDSTLPIHFVPTRLFKVTKDIIYPEKEHVTLTKFNGGIINVQNFCIWHFGYSREVFKLKNKYLNHKEKSEIHKPEFLEWWYHSHLFGEFPTSKVDYNDLPDIITDYFEINKDYLYFKDRGFELKHAECVKQWEEYFKPLGVLDIGCGRGPYLRYWENHTTTCGLELSQWAIDNKLCEADIKQGDILNKNNHFANWKLVTAIDILEHLEEKDLDKALKNIYSYGNKNFLFSIPFLGDPNLMADKTHKIFKSKEWWIEQLEKAGFKIKETPKEFYFKEQIVVAEK